MNNFLGPGGIPVFPQQIKNVNEAIENNQLVTGPHIDELKDLLCEMFGYKYASLTSNGFSSLFSSLYALKGKYNQVVTIPTSTCFAFVNASKAADFKITFIDTSSTHVDLELAGLDKETHKNSIFLCPNHFGSTTKVNHRLLPKDGFIIEDAAQSFISRKNVTSFSDALLFSFYPTKLINGINGGAVLTNNKAFHNYVSKSIQYVDQFIPENDARYNLGMNNLNAAFLLGSLENIEILEKKLLQNFQILQSICDSFSLRYLSLEKGEVPLKFIIHEKQETVDKILKISKEKTIPASRELLWLCHENEEFRFKNAKKFIEETASLPLTPFMADKDFESIESLLKDL